MPQGCFRVVAFVIGIGLSILAVLALGAPGRARGLAREGVEQVKVMLPQVREDFLLTREKFDLLAAGEFTARGAAAWVSHRGSSDLDRLRISYPSQSRENIPQGQSGLAYAYWYTIDWLTDKEKEAIVFLASSDAIAYNFEDIRASRENASLRIAIPVEGTHYTALSID